MTKTITLDIPVGLETDCEDCADRLAQNLNHHSGVTNVESRSNTTALRVTIDPAVCSEQCLAAEADQTRATLLDQFEHHQLQVAGMDCADCAQKVTRAVKRVEGVTNAHVSFTAGRLQLEARPQTDLSKIPKLIAGLGYQVVDAGSDEQQPDVARWKRPESLTAAAALLMLLAAAVDLAGAPSWLSTLLYAASIVTGGTPIARSGINALRATRRPEINLLMTIAVLGAAGIGAWLEGALVVVLFSIGELLEGRAVDRARRELEGLVSLAPDVARVRRPNASGGTDEVSVPVADVRVGEHVVVRPGERIAVDGRIAEGSSAIDQAPITGESTPVDRAVGDTVFAGTLNGQGLLVIAVESAAGDSTLDKIARLVADAQARKSPSERWVDRFAELYTPIVIVAAILTLLLPPAFGVSWDTSIYSALALLILACPCALVISTPVTIVSALARTSAAGVLVKGGAHLERAATIQTVAFDKTGTLTEGKPRLTSITALTGDETSVLTLAASLEQGSEHPLARAIVDGALARGLTLSPVDNFQAKTGLGATAVLDGVEIAAGTPRMFSGIEQRDPRIAAALDAIHNTGGTAVVIEQRSAPVGVLGLTDEPRPEAIEAITALHQLGITRTILLTGDNAAAGQSIAATVGIDEVRADLLPADKSAAIAELGSNVAMIGDGVNDAPALAAADLGIAMGSAGSDTAIEVADVALMGDDPRKIAGLIGTARWTRAIVRQNIVFSLATKFAAAIVLAFGALPLWGAVITDVGASLLVVMNGLRLLRGSPHGSMRNQPQLAPAGARAPSTNPVPDCNSDHCADESCP